MQEAANLGNQSIRLSEAMPSKWPTYWRNLLHRHSPQRTASLHWKCRIILLPQSFSGSSAAQCPQYIRTAGSAPYQLIGSLPVFIFQRFPALFLQKDEVGGTLCSLAPYSPFSVWVGVWVKHREPLFLESLRYFYCSSCARSRL